MGTDTALGSTERQNPASARLDELPLADLLRVINDEDHRVPDAVAQALPEIERATELIVASFRAGGRLIYIGAGTSGRLGIVDASECVPTFGTPPDQVVGLIAGGRDAMFTAVEGAEDDPARAAADLQALDLNDRDTVVGVAASGRTPYVIGGLDHARSVGASTISIACNPGAPSSASADVAIELDNGPEVLTGSTRMKAGTSQKLVLNMLSTASMVQIGKVYGNLMVDVVPSNHKLEGRIVRIVQTATGCTEGDARAALTAADDHAKTAIVMILAGIDADTAKQRLDAADGFVREAITPTAPEGTPR